jgi:hypothetical protein
MRRREHVGWLIAEVPGSGQFPVRIYLLASGQLVRGISLDPPDSPLQRMDSTPYPADHPLVDEHRVVIDDGLRRLLNA